MCTWQIGKKLFVSIMTLFILVIYYSTYRHPYDLKLALTHHSYHQYQSYHHQYRNTSHSPSASNVTSFNNNKTHQSNIKNHRLPYLFDHDDSKQVLNITNIQLKQLICHYLSLLHFQLLQLKPTNIKKCQQNNENLQNALLLINTNTKSIGLKYMNLIRLILQQTKNTQSNNDELSKYKCINFKIYLLREKQVLILDDQQQVQEYTRQLWAAVKKISQFTVKKMSILTSEQGAGLLLRSFSDAIDTGEFKGQVFQKMDKIILLNMYNGQMLMREPISKYLNRIKKDIISSKQKLKLFNSLSLVFINTGKRHYQMLGKTYYNGQNFLQRSTQSENLQAEKQQLSSQEPPISDSYFVFQKDIHWVPSVSDGIHLIQRTDPSQSSNNNHNNKQPSTYISLQNSTILHTMQMTNVHVSLQDGDYFHYVPFLQMLANFIVENSISLMTLKSTEYYFRYGETHGKFPLQLLADIDINDCELYNINTLEPILWTNNKKCFRLNLTSVIPNSAYLLYSESKQFHVYTEGLSRIAPYDKELNRSLYMFEKLQYPIIVYNPKDIKVILTIGEIFTPSNPLSKIFAQSEILYMNQNPHKILKQGHQNKKFIIRTCQSGNLLVFPDNFPIGKISRQFLLQQSLSSCYNEDNNSYQQFMNKITQNWAILRNIVFLILFKKLFIKCKARFADVLLSFLSISLILYYTQLRGYHNILVMFTAYIIEQAIQVICQLSEYIHIDRTKVFLTMTILYAVSYTCECFQFQRYNYWKMLLIFIVFFINKDNALLIGVKLYYIRDCIFYGHQDMLQIIQIALFMYLTRTIKDKKEVVFDSVSWLIKKIFLIGLVFYMIYSPNTDSFHSVLNFYIKSTIFLSVLKTYLNYKGWRGVNKPLYD